MIWPRLFMTMVIEVALMIRVVCSFFFITMKESLFVLLMQNPMYSFPIFQCGANYILTMHRISWTCKQKRSSGIKTRDYRLLVWDHRLFMQHHVGTMYLRFNFYRFMVKIFVKCINWVAYHRIISFTCFRSSFSANHLSTINFHLIAWIFWIDLFCMNHKYRSMLHYW